MKATADWLARVVMLVLAGLVTLSIIGSIAAIPSGSIGGRLTFAEPARDAPDSLEAGGQQLEPATETVEAQVAGSESGSSRTIAITPPVERDEMRWLEAITYALLALTGIIALATLTLWRILAQLKRIADGSPQ